jgi:hypothetical protein
MYVLKVGGGLELKYTIEYLAERVDPIAQSGPLVRTISFCHHRVTGIIHLLITTHMVV